MAKRKSGKAARKRTITKLKERPGMKLEIIVARIQQMLDPNSRVTRNEWLVDRLGNRRQYDVAVRGEFGGRRVLGVIECKDHSRKKGPDAVEAFAKKTDNLRANLRCMVSKKGFTKQALTVARHEGIECLSLLPDDPKAAGYSIGEWAYGRKYWRDNIRMHIHFTNTVPPIAGFDAMKVKWQDKALGNWVFKQLNQVNVKNLNNLSGATALEGVDLAKASGSEDLFEVGDYRIELTFKHQQPIEIEGTEYLVSGLTFEATFRCQKKRKWAHWTGDGFYNWEEGRCRIPAHGQLKTASLHSDVAAWPDYDGELPDFTKNKDKIPDIVVNSLSILAYNPDEVPDLESLEACEQ
jgi:Restriction endonuclease